MARRKRGNPKRKLEALVRRLAAKKAKEAKGKK